MDWYKDTIDRLEHVVQNLKAAQDRGAFVGGDYGDAVDAAITIVEYLVEETE
jgi:hypothetical protein